ncbi:MAG: hypothetical protein ACYTEX_11015 [Planctomycetota bacterium]|jgi:hypothetical protein
MMITIFIAVATASLITVTVVAVVEICGISRRCHAEMDAIVKRQHEPNSTGEGDGG